MDERLDRSVALRIFEGNVDKKALTKRAGIAASLTHPRVVRVFDTGQEGDSFFTVSELLPASLQTVRLPLAPDGWLYVSSLPGGPEDGSLGAQGRVYKVNPKNGKVVEVARGFVSTVNVAVADNGDVYVAQLFAGSIVRIPAGTDKGFMTGDKAIFGNTAWLSDPLAGVPEKPNTSSLVAPPPPVLSIVAS